MNWNLNVVTPHALIQELSYLPIGLYDCDIDTIYEVVDDYIEDNLTGNSFLVHSSLSTCLLTTCLGMGRDDPYI